MLSSKLLKSNVKHILFQQVCALRQPKALQRLDQNEDEPESARQEKSLIKTFLARMMEALIALMLLLVVALNMFSPKEYLFDSICTQSLLLFCIRSQTNFPRRQVFASLANLILRLPSFFWFSNFFHPTK